MMPSPAFEAITFSDSYQASVRWWRARNPRGAVLYFHGIQSHGGWYERSGGHLAEHGLTVLMPDRRGSGLNQRERGHVESVERCRRDGEEALAILLQETRLPSAHLVGVSWGGKLAVALANSVPGWVRSITLVAPGLFPKVDLTTTDKFRVAIAMMNDRDRLFDIPLNDPHLFTANPERIEFLKNDPLMLRQVTASFLLASRRLERDIRQLGHSSWRGPVHLMLAGHDPIIDNDRTRRWHRQLPSPGRRITEYPDACHTIEFEPDPARFFTDLVDWIDARCDQPPPSKVMATPQSEPRP